MTLPARSGTTIFGFAMAAFGIQNLIYADGILGLEPLPASLAGRMAIAVAVDLLLLAAGVSVVARWRERLAATTLATVLTLWLIVLHLAELVAKPSNGSAWTTMLETLALASAAWLVVALARPRVVRPTLTRGDGVPRVLHIGARFAFGAAVVGFGVLHFVYHAYVASVIPGWLPGHVAWTYLTGAAFLAAGASILSGIRASLGATLLGTMFGIWVLIVHAPRVAGAMQARAEWTSLLVALAMCGGSWVVAEWMASVAGQSSARSSDGARTDSRAA